MRFGTWCYLWQQWKLHSASFYGCQWICGKVAVSLETTQWVHLIDWTSELLISQVMKLNHRTFAGFSQGLQGIITRAGIRVWFYENRDNNKVCHQGFPTISSHPCPSVSPPHLSISFFSTTRSLRSCVCDANEWWTEDKMPGIVWFGICPLCQ